MSLEKAPPAPPAPPGHGSRRGPPIVTAPIVSQPQQELEKMLKTIERVFPSTTWEFVTSAGLEVSVNPTAALPISINVGLCLFYVKEASSPIVEKLTFKGLGGGIGWGPLPVSVAGSVPAMPSQGIGKIRRGPLGAKQLAREDFDGPSVVVEYGGSAAAGASMYVIFFGASPLLIRLLSARDFTAESFVTAATSRAVGLLFGTSAGLQGGFAATIFNGTVS